MLLHVIQLSSSGRASGQDPRGKGRDMRSQWETNEVQVTQSRGARLACLLKYWLDIVLDVS